MLHCHRERERDNYYNREREVLQQREIIITTERERGITTERLQQMKKTVQLSYVVEK